MLWAKDRREAYRAEVVVNAAVSRLTLEIASGTNVKSPFSNIRAGTLKLHLYSTRIAGPATKSP